MSKSLEEANDLLIKSGWTLKHTRRKLNGLLLEIDKIREALRIQKGVIVEQERRLNAYIAGLPKVQNTVELVHKPVGTTTLVEAIPPWDWPIIHNSETWVVRAQGGLAIIMEKMTGRHLQLEGHEAASLVIDMEMFYGSMLADDIVNSFKDRVACSRSSSTTCSGSSKASTTPEQKPAEKQPSDDSSAIAKS